MKNTTKLIWVTLEDVTLSSVSKIQTGIGKYKSSL